MYYQKNDFMTDKLSEQLTQFRKKSCCTALFGLYVENLEDIRSRRICLCNFNETVKVLRHIKPSFIDFHVRGIKI